MSSFKYPEEAWSDRQSSDLTPGSNTEAQSVSPAFSEGEKHRRAPVLFSRSSHPSVIDSASLVHNWQKTAVATIELGETGVIARLFRGCLDLYTFLLRGLPHSQVLSRRDANMIRRCHHTLTLWADGHGVWDGKLDSILERSKRLQYSTLSVLHSLCGILLTGLYKIISSNLLEDRLPRVYSNTQILFDQTKWILNGLDEIGSDTSSDSELSGDEVEASRAQSVAEEIKTYTDCLVNLSTALKCPAMDPKHTEEQPSLPRLEKNAAYDYYTDLITTKYPNARADLVECLGKVNWNRYQRMQQERDINATTRLQPVREQEILAIPKSQISASDFKDSGLGPSNPTEPSACAQSVISVLSFISSVSGGEQVRIPPLPSEGKNGGHFECTACGSLIRATSSREWRKHLFLDLQPYTCFFFECAFSAKPFAARQDWSNHLELDHQFGPSWQSIQCQLCLEFTGSGKSAVLKHFARHMEDIALAALPRDVDSEAESEPDDSDDDQGGAEERSRQILAAKEDTLGKNHPATLTAVHDLALVLQKSGKFAEAEQLCRTVVEERETRLGINHPATLASMYDLAYVLRSQMRLKEAEKISRLVFEERKRMFGIEHSDTVASQHQLIDVLEAQNNFEEVERFKKRILEDHGGNTAEDDYSALIFTGTGITTEKRGSIVLEDTRTAGAKTPSTDRPGLALEPQRPAIPSVQPHEQTLTDREERVDGLDYSHDSAKNITPPYSYVYLIGQAMLSAPGGMLTLPNIYEAIQNRYAYYRHRETLGWQSSIRHSLSSSKYFKKVYLKSNDSGKVIKWRVTESWRDDEGILKAQYLNTENEDGISVGHGSEPIEPGLPVTETQETTYPSRPITPIGIGEESQSRGHTSEEERGSQEPLKGAAASLFSPGKTVTRNPIPIMSQKKGSKFESHPEEADHAIEHISEALTAIPSARHAQSPSLSDILSNTAPPPYTLSSFMAFLSRNHCLENLEFTMDASRYRKHYAKMVDRHPGQPISPLSDESAYVLMLWRRLIDAYIREASPREVNLPFHVREKLLDISGSSHVPPHPSSLDEAVANIYELMENSAFPSYLDSLRFQNAAFTDTALQTSASSSFLPPQPSLHGAAPPGHTNSGASHYRRGPWSEHGQAVVYQCASPGCRYAAKIWPRLDNFRQHIKRLHPHEEEHDLLSRSMLYKQIFESEPLTDDPQNRVAHFSRSHSFSTDAFSESTPPWTRKTPEPDKNEMKKEQSPRFDIHVDHKIHAPFDSDLLRNEREELDKSELPFHRQANIEFTDKLQQSIGSVLSNGTFKCFNHTCEGLTYGRLADLSRHYAHVHSDTHKYKPFSKNDQRMTLPKEAIGNVLPGGKFTCRHNECANMTFGRLADLRRHQSRHTENNSQYFCPISGCPRARKENGGQSKGFGTKYKRDEHLHKVHRKSQNNDENPPFVPLSDSDEESSPIRLTQSQATTEPKTRSQVEIEASYFTSEDEVLSASDAAEAKTMEEEQSKVARSHPLYQAEPDDNGKYHCPREGEQGCTHKPTPLKCNYDKYVDSHLKPFRCYKKVCVGIRFSSTACLLRHEREAHGMHGHGSKLNVCHFNDCERSLPGNAFPRRYSLFDHMKRVHQYTGPADVSPPNLITPKTADSSELSGSPEIMVGSTSQTDTRKNVIPDSIMDRILPSSYAIQMFGDDHLSHNMADRFTTSGLNDPQLSPDALNQSYFANPGSESNQIDGALLQTGLQAADFSYGPPFFSDMTKSASASSMDDRASYLSRQQRREREINASASRKIAPKIDALNGTKSLSSTRPEIDSQDRSTVIAKTPYVRSQHPKILCIHCNDRPEGFRGSHELDRHIQRNHAKTRKGFICVDASDDKKFLANCKHCRNRKVYQAYYNAAAHLRRAHFHPRQRGRKSKNDEKRGGIGGGDDPPMDILRQHWIKEVELENKASAKSDSDGDEISMEKTYESFDIKDSVSTQIYLPPLQYPASPQPVIRPVEPNSAYTQLNASYPATGRTDPFLSASHDPFLPHIPSQHLQASIGEPGLTNFGISSASHDSLYPTINASSHVIGTSDMFLRPNPLFGGPQSASQEIDEFFDFPQITSGEMDLGYIG